MWKAMLVWLAMGVEAAEPVDPPLDVQALELYQARRYAEAEDLARQSLDERRERHGPRDEHVASSLDTLAMTLTAQGDHDAALALFEESLDIRREVFGENHRFVALSLNALALVRRVMGDHVEARVLLEQSLTMQREVLGARHLDVARNLNQLATLDYAQGNYEAAQASLEESLDIRRDALGPRHPEVATSLNNLAGLLQARGKYRAAHPMYEESLDIRREAFGSEHLNVAVSLNNLGGLLKKLGDYPAARPLYEESIEIRKEVHGAGHPQVAGALNNLALLHLALGDHASARPLIEEGLEIRREALGPRHPQVASSLNDLAELLVALGDRAVARSLHEEALSIRREALGSNHPAVARSLNNLGKLQILLEDFTEARRLLQESLDIKREVLGLRHPAVATSLNNLATVLEAQGDDSGARSLYEEVLGIRQEVLGPRHPAVAQSLNLLAHLLERLGEPDEARDLRTEALHIVEGRLTLLDALSEREALGFLPTVRPILDGWLAASEGVGVDAEAWSHQRRFKGAVAARARAARALRAVEPEVAPLATELDALRRELARLVFAESRPEIRQERAEQIAGLTAEKERLERALLSQSAGYRSLIASEQATASTLCEALPEGGALIDLFRYGADTDRYLAFVLRQADCSVVRIGLGPATPLEEAALGWREILRDPEALPERTRERGSALAELLYEPLVAVAGDDDHWIVVPDGPLATISLAALPTTDGFAIEERLITYLDRASDVLVSERPHRAQGAIVVGGVDYDADRNVADRARSLLAPCNGGHFASLPGTAQEAEQLARRWRRIRRKERVSILGGADATELAVASALEDKALAHIATHGFFATGDCRSALEDGVGYDPMLLSGLVLSGANNPPDPNAAEDGILTASEVATLDLSGTELVVLSACETGLGEVRSGQGVLGLRRAFAIAGAQTLIMSLWAVSDTETVALMDGLYTRHLRRRGLPAAQALRAAQLEFIGQHRASGLERPYEWAAFVASGAPSSGR